MDTFCTAKPAGKAVFELLQCLACIDQTEAESPHGQIYLGLLSVL